jgi:Chlamydia-phage Chp2 scaffold (Chlamy_scaf)
MKDGNEKLYDFVSRSDEGALKCDPDVLASLTVQSEAEDADINTIVRRFGITGGMPDNPVVPSFVDYDEIFDYQTARNAIVKAEEMFLEYPAELRARFNNSPQLFLEFCSDKENLKEMQKLGLLREDFVDNSSTAPESPPVSSGEGTDV